MSSTAEQNKTDNQCIVEEKITKVTGDIQIRKYIKGRLLGKGGFAKCYEFTNMETKQITAAKVIPKKSLVKSRAKQKLISEIKIHKSLHHPNIVNFEHYFEDSENVYLLIEICQNQTLKIHRDLKLGNLFINEKMELKVGDFGLATKLEFDGERKRTVCGTPNYIAPEILEGKTGHSFEVDIWSLGVIIYTLIIGKPPFETNNVKETYKRIKNDNYSFPENALISEPSKELIQSILVLDPNKRPNLDQILVSDFFNMGINVPKLLQPSTLACPPSLNYIKQFIPDVGPNGILNNYKSKKKVYNNVDGNDDIISDRTKLQSQQSIKMNNFGNNPSNINNNESRPFTTSGLYNITKSNTNNIYQSNHHGNLDNKNDIWVKKWIDYSSKYGLGYILSNGHVGVYFNDSTKIIYRPNGMNFIYVERKPQERTEIVTPHLLSEEFNKDLNKKVILLQHFKAYLLEENKNNPIEKKESENIDMKNYVYVKKWMRTKHAILFRLSNKIVQVCFLDQTEIILSSETRVVTYVDKKGERLTFPLSSALDSNNNEMTKRLRYTKQILMHMLTARTQGNQNSQNGNNNQTASSTNKP